MEIYFFLFFAIVAVASSVAMILQRNPIYCVLLLIMVMISIAGLYLMLDAQFVAIIQIVVYAGAIMVLFLFVIMLLNLSREEGGVFRIQKPLAVILAALLFLPVAAMIMSYAGGGTTPPADGGGAGFGEVEQIGTLLFTKYLLPVEIAAVLLLIAIVGAVVLTRKGTVSVGE
ncbi:MAG: NADH-quinone oxidoreductase subunit J [Gemmatimonadetes bacterium]|nr:NADH-quinone oxidoreductase subunit J [Gemmatimonadota bacterium]MYG85338.1 NADH-quinone oxidoreductase subunit J [Gemmatimonadota bacterium]MYJ89005.1 NADH-quinone oxidoreductase subunit J [Gemmatimonadota bacterium]